MWRWTIGLPLLAACFIVLTPGTKAACTLDALVGNLNTLVGTALSQQSTVMVVVVDQNVVCLSTSMTRGSYRRASVVVNCTGTGATVLNSCPSSGGRLYPSIIHLPIFFIIISFESL